MILMSFLPSNAKEDIGDLINEHKLNLIVVSERKLKEVTLEYIVMGLKKLL